MFQPPLFVFLLACVSLVLAQDQEVFSQCFNVPVAGQVCIRVNSRDCFELTGTVTLNGAIIGAPQYVPIGTILSTLQDRLDDPSHKSDKTVCRTINLGANFPEFECGLCTNITDLHIEGDNLHYCGSLTVSCSSPFTTQNFIQTFTPRCVDIKNCELFGCRNNCNRAGTCTALGICKCNAGHYGLDCSVEVDNNCIQSNAFDRTCWKAEFSDCQTIDFQVTSPVGEISREYAKLDEIDSLELLPCQELAENVNCEMCVEAKNLQVIGSELKGCPTVKLTCEDIVVSNYQIDCLTLIKSDKLVCPTSPSNAPKNDTGFFGILGGAGTGKTILLVLACTLALLFIAGLGYFAMTKYFGFDLPNPFRQVDVYTEDEAPLRTDITDEDLEEESID